MAKHSDIQLASSINWIIVSLSMVIYSTTFAHSFVFEIAEGFENVCFIEKVSKDVRMTFSFEVIDGGFFDVDVFVKDPKNVIINQKDRASEGKFVIDAILEGPYQYCFNNFRTSKATKSIIFDIDRSDKMLAHSRTDDQMDDETSKLFKMSEKLLLHMMSARHDVRYLSVRDKIHRRISEATNSRVVWWSSIEFLMLLLVTLGQVWYIKRFFEIRKTA